MSTKYKATIPGKAYFLTITTVNWVDVFTRLNLRYIIVNSLNYCIEHKGLEVYAYCLMPSHLHLMCRAKDDNIQLCDIIRDLKNLLPKKLLQTFLKNRKVVVNGS